ncbi:electron transport complex subunit RsxC [Aliidiomarina sp. B3213]|uniref:electron transport complex subunit RsxC n=1 Tax=Aliidiomarina sp. B3213 TaxID=2249757 RepID=UPI000DD077AF|nr:electron transport complex subunit RsxC [Aliidiomarina sp. B3213]RTE87591.1 electron transport complex subunit RsxC [Aliidiomarina sp. B3213]
MASAIKIWSFPGGVHPPERKTLANQTATATTELPEKVYVPVKQHIGAEGQLLVQPGDTVLRGQALTQPGMSGGLPVHAPSSGTVINIAEHTSNHPSGIPTLTITIKLDGKHESIEFTAVENPLEQSPQELIKYIREAGIAGLGGAAYPTAQKLSQTQNTELLIINGVECEPYIVSDDRLMREHAEEIVSGITILQSALQAQQTIVAIEDNKPEAIQAMRQAIESASIEAAVAVVPTKYPSGGEKQLIQLLTGKEVPSNGYPSDMGILMQNVGTAYAIHEAIYLGKPLMERIVTLTGEALQKPGTVWALLGTPVSHLLDSASLQASSKQKVIIGGPMMGYTISDLEVPVVKSTNCILCPTESELPATGHEMACIRCGQCEQVCPASLLPQQLYWYAKASDHDALKQHHLKDCIECGACAYVCPSEIPLVHYYRKAKAEIREELIEQQKADIARQRFEARQARLEREKQARLEKHKKAAEARQAALAARAAAAEADPTEQSTADTAANNGEKQSKVAAAIARAKAKNAAQAESATAEDDKKARVAEAVARAKAKKAAQAESATAEDDKKARVAEAVARAKAKKAAQAESATPEDDKAKQSSQQSDNAEAEKKRRVAAAVARAKAKKAEQQKQQNSVTTSERGDSESS